MRGSLFEGLSLGGLYVYVLDCLFLTFLVPSHHVVDIKNFHGLEIPFFFAANMKGILIFYSPLV